VPSIKWHVEWRSVVTFLLSILDAVPAHVKFPISIGELFRFAVDVTGPPRKALVRLLADHAKQKREQRMLLYLCSRQGKLSSSHFKRLY
jgi:sulfite reductase alpha subunit-like flavoprotein